MSELRRMDLRSDPDADLSGVLDHIRADGLIAYPTETVYGLGGACTKEGVRRLRKLKGRSADKPVSVLVESASAVGGLRWSDDARELAEVFWPGSVTLVLEDPESIFPEGVRSGLTGSVGVRVSPHPFVARLLAELAAPITSTSLNAPGETSASSGEEAMEILRGLGGTDVWVLDSGTLPPSGPSTVVDCTAPEPVVLREGTVPVQRLRCVIPDIHGTERV